MNKYITVVFLCFLCMFGCEKEINYKRNGFIFPKIVTNCQFTPDSLWQVYLTNSSGIGSARPTEALRDAFVTIYTEDGVSIQLNHQGDGLYSHPTLRPVANTKYDLEVSAVDYETITARNNVPLDIKTAVLDTFTTDLFESSVLQMKVEIEDPISEENYYIIECIVKLTDSIQSTQNFRGRFYTLDNRSENNEFLGEQESHNRIFLRDDKFNGQKITTEFAYVRGPAGSNFVPFEPYDRTDLQIYILSVSEELYEFILSVDKSRLNSGVGLPVDPVPIESNIDKGFGIFGGYTQEVFDYQLQ